MSTKHTFNAFAVKMPIQHPIPFAIDLSGRRYLTLNEDEADGYATDLSNALCQDCFVVPVMVTITERERQP